MLAGESGLVLTEPRARSLGEGTPWTLSPLVPLIRDAAKLYISALQSDKADVSALMGLYAEVSSMRVLSSASVVDRADEIVKEIINAYLEPNKTFPELREMANSGLIDPIRNFSEACRAESERLHFGPPA
jgi:hypothetical protein